MKSVRVVIGILQSGEIFQQALQMILQVHGSSEPSPGLSGARPIEYDSKMDVIKLPYRERRSGHDDHVQPSRAAQLLEPGSNPRIRAASTGSAGRLEKQARFGFTIPGGISLKRAIGSQGGIRSRRSCLVFAHS